LKCRVLSLNLIFFTSPHLECEQIKQNNKVRKNEQ
jgi:hypothetical protein